MADIVLGATPVHFGMIDHSGENTGVKLYLPALEGDGSNLEAVLTDTVTSAAQVVKDGLIDLTDCNMLRTTASIQIDESMGTNPSIVTAQREIAFRFIYQDNDSGLYYSYTVPGPATALYPSSGTDELDMGSPDMIAWAIIFEANCVSPAGNPVTLISGRLVGRNN